MKVASYSRDEVEKLFEFNDENGKYCLEGTDFSITINSWNNIMDIYFSSDYSHLTSDDIKLLYEVFTTLYFDKDVDDND